MDATLSRLKRQQALQEEKKRAEADAAAAAEQAVREGQPLDPDFRPNGIGSGQFGNPEAEDKAAGTAQLANHMGQVMHLSIALCHGHQFSILLCTILSGVCYSACHVNLPSSIQSACMCGI